MKKPASFIDYLNNPERYQAFHQSYSRRPRPPIDRLSARWAQGPAPQFLNPPIQDDPGLTMPLLGPGGIVNAPYEGKQPPHTSLAAALAPPLASPETPAPPEQMGWAPHQPLPGGGHFDSGVAPGMPGITGGTAPGGYANGVDMANATNPLRLPRRVMPGQASAQTRGMFDDRIGDVLLRLLGVSG